MCSLLSCATGSALAVAWVYFRALLVEYFEGLDSERGIAWRVADSLALRRFLLIGLDDRTPDHSAIGGPCNTIPVAATAASEVNLAKNLSAVSRKRYKAILVLPRLTAICQ